jgi:cytochrome c556
MKKQFALFSGLLALLLALPASAQFAKPEDAIKYRKASFTVMSAHFGRVGAMAAGRAPFDAKAAAENADIAAAMSKLPWAAFTEGSTKAIHAPSQKFGKTAPSTKKPQTKCKPNSQSFQLPPKLAMSTR